MKTHMFYVVGVVLFLGLLNAVSGKAEIATEKSVSPAVDMQSLSNSQGTWECWADGLVNPCHNHLLRLAVSSSTSSWATGFNGAILHWDGASWSDVDSPVSANIFGIDSIADDDVWAVSAGGILHWDGNEWSITDSTGSLLGIDMISATEGWAVGNNGAIRHWDGFEWTTVDSPTTDSLSTIDMVSTTHGWAAGWPNALLHWDGTEWMTVTNPVVNTITSISMLSETDGWAVGSGGTIIHWDGVEWSAVSSPTTNSLEAVHMLSATEGWAVGSGGIILRWDGVEWTLVSSPTTYPLIDVKMVSATEGWAVGYYGTILFWNGTEWTAPFVGQHPDLTPTAVKILSPTEGWMAGIGMDAILRWNGLTWTPITLPGAGATLYGLDALSNNDVWAVGHGGSAYHWNGTVWDEIGQAAPDTLNAVSMSATDNVWSVGENGAIVHWDGNNWNSVSSPTAQTLEDITMVSETDGWAVGASGIILRWNGNEWSLVTSPTGNTLYSIDMVSATEGWAVGASGTIIQWDGNAWSIVASPPMTPRLQSVKLNSATNGWAVGFNGKILHWDGTTWNMVDSPTHHILYGLDMLSDGMEGWVVGFPSVTVGIPVILRYTAPAVEPVNDVSLSGIAVGTVDTAYSFMATVQPLSTTLPITYDWQATGQFPVTYTDGLTNTASFSWDISGTKTVTVTASNEAGNATISTTILIGDVVATVEPGIGSTFVYTDTNGSLTQWVIPAGAVTDTTDLVYLHQTQPEFAPPTGLTFGGNAFALRAYQNGIPQTNLSFENTVTVTIQYNPLNITGLDEDSLALYYWDTDAETWLDAATTCDPVSEYQRQSGEISVGICHLTDFALFGNEGVKVYLPLIVR